MNNLDLRRPPRIRAHIEKLRQEWLAKQNAKPAGVSPAPVAQLQPASHPKLLDFDPDSLVHKSLWPKNGADLASYFQEGDLGLGDVIERLIRDKGVSIFAALKSLVSNFGLLSTMTGAYKHLTGEDCSCPAKKFKLNRRFPRAEWIKPHPNLAIFTYADGDHTFAANGLFRSLKQRGVVADLHVYTPNRIASADYAHNHKVADGSEEKRHWLFKLEILRNQCAKLNYDYFCWMDADQLCVRAPGDLLRLMGGDPVHCFLAGNLAGKTSTPDWWGPKMPAMVEMMRDCGVTSSKVYGTNGGLFIVRKDAIEEFYSRAMKFWNHAKEKGYRLADEPAIAAAMVPMMASPEAHENLKWLDLWAEEWTGALAGKIPDGTPWEFKDFFNQDDRRQVNPAIVHAMRSKASLVENGAK